jgi:hypothetical protein
MRPLLKAVERELALRRHRLSQGDPCRSRLRGRVSNAKIRCDRITPLRSTFAACRTALIKTSSVAGPRFGEQGGVPHHTRLTPRLQRTCRPGDVASLTIRSDTLFNETSCPLKGFAFFRDLVANLHVARKPARPKDRIVQIGCSITAAEGLVPAVSRLSSLLSKPPPAHAGLRPAVERAALPRLKMLTGIRQRTAH